MKNVREFLESDEIDEKSLDMDGKHLREEVAASIENATFCWNGPKPTADQSMVY